jgi:hypothetical protein
MRSLGISVLVLLLTSFCVRLEAQRTGSFIDVVYLKNGNIIKGTITERIPGESVTIETQDGNVWTFNFAEIERITTERTRAGENEPVPKHPVREPVPKRPLQEHSGSDVDANKLMLYQKESKSTGTAVLLSLVITSAGHAYAGNWPRGLLFTAGRVGGVVLALTAGIQHKKDYYSYGYYYTYYSESTEITDWYWVGLGSSLVLAIWEAIDAAGEANRYNDDLYERITGQQRIGINLVPGPNGGQVRFTYNF